MDEVDEKGMPYTKPTHGKTIGEKLWDEVDKCMVELKSGTSTDGEYFKYRAATLCEVIQMHLPHFWVNIDMVRAEALKRWKISQGKLDWEPTPGYQFNPPPHDSEAYKRLLAGDQMERGAARKATSASKRTTAPATVQLTEEVTQAIRNGLKMGFEPELLSSTYNLPLSVVISLRE